MTKMLLVLIGLAMLSTVSMGCKAEGKVDTTAAPHTITARFGSQPDLGATALTCPRRPVCDEGPGHVGITAAHLDAATLGREQAERILPVGGRTLTGASNRARQPEDRRPGTIGPPSGSSAMMLALIRARSLDRAASR